MNVLPAILRVVTLLAGVLFLLPAAAASARLDVASGLSALAAAIVGVTLWKPVDGLAILAGLLPLATSLSLLIAAPLGGARTAEFLVLAFLGAASLRMGLNRSPSCGSLTVPILANIGVVVSAVAVGLVGEQLGTEMPLPFWRGVRRLPSRRSPRLPLAPSANVIVIGM